jgi:hypothetical protein
MFVFMQVHRANVFYLKKIFFYFYQLLPTFYSTQTSLPASGGFFIGHFQARPPVLFKNASAQNSLHTPFGGEAVQAIQREFDY